MSKKANRYTTVARFYDYDASERMNKDIPFYINYAKKVNALNILDLCCGTGRVAIPLAKEGYHVKAIDQSEAMLAVFKQKLSTLPNDVTRKIKVVDGDATDFALDKNFQLAIIPYRSFQQFAHQVDAINCLKCVHKHLVDGGLFIVTAIRPAKQLDASWVYPKTKQWEVVENGKRIIKYHWGEKIDIDRGLIHPVLCYEVIDGEDKDVFYEDLTLKYYYHEQMVKMIESTGFTIVEQFGDYEGCDIDSGTELIYVCKKEIPKT